ncbi:MAG: aspartate 1-decarboxylase [Candidatus Firestonebacteria bacterium RIFOXYC2_FULL_39_67]|nr:MAG: aspartate 1-decarboxylase [Candidatus Firestonebacteria bacterium RIFOXYD2_FULL_39_29]OGF57631.1 MAG: aspartate 1-decarboxylase [Candidatus Firestonebacteria bacterium RIFOXYC2_FULL_39_67]
MLRYMCKSKIHRATVTDANINYRGSITIDEKLMKSADILPFERVQVLNISSGGRLETYAIKGKKGEMCLNGAAARLAQIGDIIIIISYGLFSNAEAKKLKPRIIFVDNKNNQVKG